MFSLSVGGALFLEHFSADDLPFAYIAASVLLPLVGLLQLTIARRVSFVRFQLGVLCFLGTTTAVFMILLHLSSSGWPVFALFVWYAVEFQLANIVLWSTASRVFTVRQGKRLFGLIGSGEIVSAILGGALAPVLIRHLGTLNLLSISMVGFFLAMVNFGVLTAVCRRRLARDPMERAAARSRRRESLFRLVRSRYLVLIFLVYAFYIACSFFVNNIFYFELGASFHTPGELAGFLARFMAAASFLGLLFRALLSGRILVRFGLLSGLLITPLALSATALAVVGLSDEFSGLLFVFWSVVLMRLMERVFMGAFGQPAYYTLYQPLSRERRVHVQTAAESVAGPLAGGATGVVLLVLTKSLSLGTVGLCAAAIPVLLAWVGVSFAASRGYRTALTSALRRRGLAGGDLKLNDPVSLRILERGLESRRPLEVLYCLKLLHEAEHPGFRDLLAGLLQHEVPDVRRGVSELIELTVARDLENLLREHLQEEPDPATRAALLRALAAGGGERVAELIETHCADPSSEVRRGALVAMMLYCGARAREEGTSSLRRLVAAAAATERVQAAQVLGELGTDAEAKMVLALLEDPELEVRRAMLGALRSSTRAEVWRGVLCNLEAPELRIATLRTLQRAGEDSLPAIAAVYADATTTRAQRRLILQLFGRSESPAAIELLLAEIEVNDRGLLSEVLWSLHLCGFTAAGREQGRVDEVLRGELRHAAWLTAARRDLQREPGVELLTAALEQELAQSHKRLFLLLSFLYDADTMLKVWTNFGASPALRDLALELLDERLSSRHRAVVLPILAGRVDERARTAAVRVRQILDGDGMWRGTWLQAAAVEWCTTRAELLREDQWSSLEENGSEVIRETALARRRGGSATRPLSTVERVRVLRATAVFREIDDEVLAELAQCLEELRLAAGELLYREGEQENSMFLVVEGRLRSTLGGDVVDEVGAGEVCGELSALVGGAREETVSAASAAHLFQLAGPELNAFMASRIEAVRGIVSMLCQRVRHAPTDKLAGREEKEREATEALRLPVELDREDYLSSLEKVLILKTADIFSEVADDILAEVAERTGEVRLKKNEVLFHKGDPGTTTYIVAVGRIRIHIGDQWIADATERAVVGELAALSSEPRTASVTAAEDSLLLALDQESLFELMWDQHEIVRGIIRVLVGRLQRLHDAART